MSSCGSAWGSSSGWRPKFGGPGSSLKFGGPGLSLKFGSPGSSLMLKGVSYPRVESHVLRGPGFDSDVWGSGGLQSGSLWVKSEVCGPRGLEKRVWGSPTSFSLP